MVLDDEMDDPRCPECGGPIAARASYCIHCSADLRDRRPVDAAAVGRPADDRDAEVEPPVERIRTASGTPVEHPLDPEGVVDNTLTVLVGILGGIIIGLVGTVVMLVLRQSLWSVLFGLAVWLGSTAYLVRRRYLLEAVSKAAYGVAIVLLSIPFIALVFEGGLLDRAGILLIMLLVVGVPAGIAVTIGWFASRYVPD